MRAVCVVFEHGVVRSRGGQGQGRPRCVKWGKVVRVSRAGRKCERSTVTPAVVARGATIWCEKVVVVRACVGLREARGWFRRTVGVANLSVSSCRRSPMVSGGYLLFSFLFI